MSIRELWDLVNGVLTTPGTRFNSSYWAVERYSMTDLMLVSLRNSVINGWDAKLPDKKRAMFYPEKPSTPEERKERKQNKKRIGVDHLERVRARKAITTDVDVVEVEKDYYHIDKSKVIRKCKKNGVDCKISDKHFESREDAENNLNI